MQKLTIHIASESIILAKGLHLLISELRGSFLISSVDTVDELRKNLLESKPQILVLSCGFIENKSFDINEISRLSPDTKVFGIMDSGKVEASSLMFHSFVDIRCTKEVFQNSLMSLILEFQENESIEEETSELSQREKMILKHVAMGMANKEIADKLFISMHTVITHRKKITRKLGIKTISGLTVYAIINGLLGMEDIDK